MCISVGTICTKMFVFVPRTSDSVGPENTHHSGCRYHCMADPLFDWFEFDQTSKVHSTNAKQFNLKKISTDLHKVSVLW